MNKIVKTLDWIRYITIKLVHESWTMTVEPISKLQPCMISLVVHESYYADTLIWAQVDVISEEKDWGQDLVRIARREKRSNRRFLVYRINEIIMLKQVKHQNQIYHLHITREWMKWTMWYFIIKQTLHQMEILPFVLCVLRGWGIAAGLVRE